MKGQTFYCSSSSRGSSITLAAIRNLSKRPACPGSRWRSLSHTRNLLILPASWISGGCCCIEYTLSFISILFYPICKKTHIYECFQKVGLTEREIWMTTPLPLLPNNSLQSVYRSLHPSPSSFWSSFHFLPLFDKTIRLFVSFGQKKKFRM